MEEIILEKKAKMSTKAKGVKNTLKSVLVIYG